MEISELESKELKSVVSEIKKVSQKRFSSFLIVPLVFLLLSVYCGIWLESSSNNRDFIWKAVYYIDHYVKCFLKRKNYSVIDFNTLVIPDGYIDKSKDVVKGILESWANVSLSYNSIIAATIILFYSIMENKQEGIANRRIMAFAFGSATTPLLFCVSMILLIFYYIFWQSSYYFISLFIIAYVLLNQFGIMIMILFSASHYGHNKIVPVIEEKQLRCLIDNRSLTNKYKIHIWTYFTRHMSEAISSSEIVADQMILVREILDVPIKLNEKLEKEGNSLRRKVHKTLSKIFIGVQVYLCGEKQSLSHTCGMKDIVHIGRDDYYAFYYNNLISAFERLQNKELELTALIGAVEDFLIRLTLKGLTTDDYWQKTLEQVPIIFASVMNALYSENYKSIVSPTDRCVDLYNHIITVTHNNIETSDEKRKNKIESLEKNLFLIYVFYIGFLFYTDKNEDLYSRIDVSHESNFFEKKNSQTNCNKRGGKVVPAVKGIQDLKGTYLLDRTSLQIDGKPEVEQFIFDIWRNWTEASNIGVYRFVNVLDTYNGKTHKCFAVRYVLNRLKLR